MHRIPCFVGLILASFTALAPAHARENVEAWYREQGYAAPSGSGIIACHGYGCARRDLLELNQPWFGKIEAVMRHGDTSPDAERRIVGEALRLYTAALASKIGGKPDLPRSPPAASGVQGQLDCLDTTANVTSLLLVLEERGLLKNHTVSLPQSRGFFLDGRWPHYTAVLADAQGRRWALDPWPYSPGKGPDILPLDAWMRGAK